MELFWGRALQMTDNGDSRAAIPFRTATGHPAGDTDMVQYKIETEPDSLFTGRSNEILELIQSAA